MIDGALIVTCVYYLSLIIVVVTIMIAFLSDLIKYRNSRMSKIYSI